MQYYVLGTKNNGMLEWYLKRYYIKLQENLDEIWKFLWDEVQERIQKLLDLWEKNRDFIMNGDISSVINYLYLECIKKVDQWLWSYNVYAKQLEKEIQLFLEWDINDLSLNDWEKIAWTNIRLSLKDSDPYGNLEAHPEHKINWGVRWWGEKTKWEWWEVYEKTFSLLKKVDEWVYEELNKIITKIVPLWTADWLHNSASYKECVGHLYMWYTLWVSQPELNNLEAIIHESSHNKLNLIKQFDPLILSDLQEKYYSPYRPDARHISGIYLGIHAFVPVIYILMKAYSQGKINDDGHWLEKITLYYLKNKFCLRVLKKHWKFSELWNEILSEIEEVMNMTDQLYKDVNPEAEIVANAKRAMIGHFQEVNSNYPHLEY